MLDFVTNNVNTSQWQESFSTFYTTWRDLPCSEKATTVAIPLLAGLVVIAATCFLSKRRLVSLDTAAGNRADVLPNSEWEVQKASLTPDEVARLAKQDYEQVRHAVFLDVINNRDMEVLDLLLKQGCAPDGSVSMPYYFELFSACIYNNWGDGVKRLLQDSKITTIFMAWNAGVPMNLLEVYHREKILANPEIRTCMEIIQRHLEELSNNPPEWERERGELTSCLAAFREACREESFLSWGLSRAGH